MFPSSPLSAQGLSRERGLVHACEEEKWLRGNCKSREAEVLSEAGGPGEAER